MGESRRKRDKKPPIKPTEKLDKLITTKDKALNDAQRSFCRSIIDKMLDDASSLSFSKPVNELWDPSVLTDYFEKITKPMDLGTVRKRIASAYNFPDSDFFDPNAFREEARLVFLNAVSYNGKGSDLGRLGTKFIHFIDSQLEDLPVPREKPDDDSTVVVSNNKKKPSNSDDYGGGDDEDGNTVSGDGANDTNSNSGTPRKSNEKKSTSSSKRSSETDTKEDDDEDDEEEEEEEDDDDENKADDGDLEDKDDAEMEDKAESGSASGNGVGGPKDEDEEHEGTASSGGGKGSSALEEGERSRLNSEMSKWTKTKSRAHANLAEIELQKNVPLTYEENSKLRDEVEGLSWEMSQKVVSILRKYVDDALKNSDEADPEYVTLEFSRVEPRLLREIEALIRPDPRVEQEKETIDKADREIENVKRKLKRLNENGVSSSSKKKKSKKSR